MSWHTWSWRHGISWVTSASWLECRFLRCRLNVLRRTFLPLLLPPLAAQRRISGGFTSTSVLVPPLCFRTMKAHQSRLDFQASLSLSSLLHKIWPSLVKQNMHVRPCGFQWCCMLRRFLLSFSADISSQTLYLRVNDGVEAPSDDQTALWAYSKPPQSICPAFEMCFDIRKPTDTNICAVGQNWRRK